MRQYGPKRTEKGTWRWQKGPIADAERNYEHFCAFVFNFVKLKNLKALNQDNEIISKLEQNVRETK